MFAIKVETPPDDVKAMGQTKEILEGLSPERQQKVVRAVYRGEVLTDPADAAVAVRFARSLIGRPKSRYAWLRWLGAAAVITYLAIELVVRLRRSEYGIPDWPTIVLAFYLFGHVYGVIAGRRIRENARRAERLNLQLAQSAGLLVETIADAPEPTSPPALEPLPPLSPTALEPLPPLTRPSKAEILLGFSVASFWSLALLPDRGAPSDPVETLFGLAAFAAFGAALTGTFLAYRGRGRTPASTRSGGRLEAEMLVGFVLALLWGLMLMVVLSGSW